MSLQNLKTDTLGLGPQLCEGTLEVSREKYKTEAGVHSLSNRFPEPTLSWDDSRKAGISFLTNATVALGFLEVTN